MSVPRRLVLASGSRYRHELLTRLKVRFEVMVSDTDETRHPGEDARALTERLAIAKARAVSPMAPDALIIGSDQVAEYEGEIVGKPGGFEEAARQLRRISGKTARLYTGLALLNAQTGRVQSEVALFEVAFRVLDERRIARYLEKERPYDCAGSVKSEGLGIALFERFIGDDPTTLIGLPLIRLVRMLEAEGFEVP
ncbi:nucleoside triphosphate pyrophosphatase [Acidiferrobacter sp.]|uniref:Maf family protein n=1 Tax=Acidiferrobacter sp. TaxID=1872107 RepID=UPI00261D9352|nr:nucleoside triphosphate pyrophosphatase [Acidiferrobacter sp.]